MKWTLAILLVAALIPPAILDAVLLFNWVNQ